LTIAMDAKRFPVFHPIGKRAHLGSAMAPMLLVVDGICRIASDCVPFRLSLVPSRYIGHYQKE